MDHPVVIVEDEVKIAQLLQDYCEDAGYQTEVFHHGEIALAWLLAQKPWIVPIPGSRKLERLDENIGALAIELKPDDLQEINQAISKITVQGDRYPEKLEQMTGR